MVNFKQLQDKAKEAAGKAKEAVDKTGGVDGLKRELGEVKTAVGGKGSLKDKAMAAKEALTNSPQPGAEETVPEAVQEAVTGDAVIADDATDAPAGTTTTTPGAGAA